MSTRSLPNADPALMRRMNCVRVLAALKGHGELTLTALVASTGLSRRTVEAALDALLADGSAREIAADPSTGTVGRPARRYRFHAASGHVLGVEIVAHQVRAIVTDLEGATQASATAATSRKANRKQRLAATAQAITTALEAAGTSGDALYAAAAGTHGLIDDSGTVSLCRVLNDWEGVRLADELAAIVGRPVGVYNDANLSAIAEHTRGAATDADTLVWATLGRAFAAGVIIDGRLFRGAHGAAGEFGWTPEFGWPAILAHPLSHVGSKGRQADQAQQILQAARAGDPSAHAAVDEFAALLAPGLGSMVLAYDPECLVIGGPAAAAGDALLEPLAAQLRPRCLQLPDLRVSTLGADSIVLGAVSASLSAAEETLLSTQPARCLSKPNAISRRCAPGEPTGAG